MYRENTGIFVSSRTKESLLRMYGEAQKSWEQRHVILPLAILYEARKGVEHVRSLLEVRPNERLQVNLGLRATIEVRQKIRSAVVAAARTRHQAKWGPDAILAHIAAEGRLLTDSGYYAAVLAVEQEVSMPDPNIGDLDLELARQAAGVHGTTSLAWAKALHVALTADHERRGAR